MEMEVEGENTSKENADTSDSGIDCNRSVVDNTGDLYQKIVFDTNSDSCINKACILGCDSYKNIENPNLVSEESSYNSPAEDPKIDVSVTSDKKDCDRKLIRVPEKNDHVHNDSLFVEDMYKKLSNEENAHTWKRSDSNSDNGLPIKKKNLSVEKKLEYLFSNSTDVLEKSCLEGKNATEFDNNTDNAYSLSSQLLDELKDEVTSVTNEKEKLSDSKEFANLCDQVDYSMKLSKSRFVNKLFETDDPSEISFNESVLCLQEISDSLEQMNNVTEMQEANDSIINTNRYKGALKHPFIQLNAKSNDEREFLPTIVDVIGASDLTNIRISNVVSDATADTDISNMSSDTSNIKISNVTSTLFDDLNQIDEMNSESCHAQFNISDDINIEEEELDCLITSVSTQDNAVKDVKFIPTTATESSDNVDILAAVKIEPHSDDEEKVRALIWPPSLKVDADRTVSNSRVKYVENKKSHICSDCESEIEDDDDHCCRKGSPIPMAYICSKCNATFKDHKKLQMHMAVHNKPLEFQNSRQEQRTTSNCISYDGGFYCCICRQIYTTFIALHGHMSSHNIEKPYYCIVCNKQYKVQQSLLMHIDMHLNIHLHRCNTCYSLFDDKFQCSNHMRRAHKVDIPNYLTFKIKDMFISDLNKLPKENSYNKRARFADTIRQLLRKKGLLRKDTNGTENDNCKSKYSMDNDYIPNGGKAKTYGSAKDIKKSVDKCWKEIDSDKSNNRIKFTNLRRVPSGKRKLKNIYDDDSSYKFFSLSGTDTEESNSSYECHDNKKMKIDDNRSPNKQNVLYLRNDNSNVKKTIEYTKQNMTQYPVTNNNVDQTCEKNADFNSKKELKKELLFNENKNPDDEKQKLSIRHFTFSPLINDKDSQKVIKEEDSRNHSIPIKVQTPEMPHRIIYAPKLDLENVICNDDEDDDSIDDISIDDDDDDDDDDNDVSIEKKSNKNINAGLNYDSSEDSDYIDYDSSSDYDPKRESVTNKNKTTIYKNRHFNEYKNDRITLTNSVKVYIDSSKQNRGSELSKKLSNVNKPIAATFNKNKIYSRSPSDIVKDFKSRYNDKPSNNKILDNTRSIKESQFTNMNARLTKPVDKGKSPLILVNRVRKKYIHEILDVDTLKSELHSVPINERDKESDCVIVMEKLPSKSPLEEMKHGVIKKITRTTTKHSFRKQGAFYNVLKMNDKIKGGILEKSKVYKNDAIMRELRNMSNSENINNKQLISSLSKLQADNCDKQTSSVMDSLENLFNEEFGITSNELPNDLLDNQYNDEDDLVTEELKKVALTLQVNDDKREETVVSKGRYTYTYNNGTLLIKSIKIDDRSTFYETDLDPYLKQKVERMCQDREMCEEITKKLLFLMKEKQKLTNLQYERVFKNSLMGPKFWKILLMKYSNLLSTTLENVNLVRKCSEPGIIKTICHLWGRATGGRLIKTHENRIKEKLSYIIDKLKDDFPSKETLLMGPLFWKQFLLNIGISNLNSLMLLEDKYLDSEIVPIIRNFTGEDALKIIKQMGNGTNVSEMDTPSEFIETVVDEAHDGSSILILDELSMKGNIMSADNYQMTHDCSLADLENCCTHILKIPSKLSTCYKKSYKNHFFDDKTNEYVVRNNSTETEALDAVYDSKNMLYELTVPTSEVGDSSNVNIEESNELVIPTGGYLINISPENNINLQYLRDAVLNETDQTGLDETRCVELSIIPNNGENAYNAPMSDINDIGKELSDFLSIDYAALSNRNKTNIDTIPDKNIADVVYSDKNEPNINAQCTDNINSSTYENISITANTSNCDASVNVENDPVFDLTCNSNNLAEGYIKDYVRNFSTSSDGILQYSDNNLDAVTDMTTINVSNVSNIGYLTYGVIPDSRHINLNTVTRVSYTYTSSIADMNYAHRNSEVTYANICTNSTSTSKDLHDTTNENTNMTNIVNSSNYTNVDCYNSNPAESNSYADGNGDTEIVSDYVTNSNVATDDVSDSMFEMQDTDGINVNTDVNNIVNNVATPTNISDINASSMVTDNVNNTGVEICYQSSVSNVNFDDADTDLNNTGNNDSNSNDQNPGSIISDDITVNTSDHNLLNTLTIVDTGVSSVTNIGNTDSNITRTDPNDIPSTETNEFENKSLVFQIGIGDFKIDVSVDGDNLYSYENIVELVKHSLSCANFNLDDADTQNVVDDLSNQIYCIQRGLEFGGQEGNILYQEEGSITKNDNGIIGNSEENESCNTNKDDMNQMDIEDTENQMNMVELTNQCLNSLEVNQPDNANPGCNNQMDIDGIDTDNQINMFDVTNQYLHSSEGMNSVNTNAGNVSQMDVDIVDTEDQMNMVDVTDQSLDNLDKKKCDNTSTDNIIRSNIDSFETQKQVDMIHLTDQYLNSSEAKKFENADDINQMDVDNIDNENRINMINVNHQSLNDWEEKKFNEASTDNINSIETENQLNMIDATAHCLSSLEEKKFEDANVCNNNPINLEITETKNQMDMTDQCRNSSAEMDAFSVVCDKNKSVHVSLNCANICNTAEEMDKLNLNETKITDSSPEEEALQGSEADKLFKFIEKSQLNPLTDEKEASINKTTINNTKRKCIAKSLKVKSVDRMNSINNIKLKVGHSAAKSTFKKLGSEGGICSFDECNLGDEVKKSVESTSNRTDIKPESIMTSDGSDKSDSELSFDEHDSDDDVVKSVRTTSNINDNDIEPEARSSGSGAPKSKFETHSDEGESFSLDEFDFDDKIMKFDSSQINIQDSDFVLRVCTTCGSLYNIDFNMEAVIPESNFPCNICLKLLPERKQLVNHYFKCHCDCTEPFKCGLCNAEFSFWYVYCQHFRTHVDSVNFCQKCS